MLSADDLTSPAAAPVEPATEVEPEAESEKMSPLREFEVKHAQFLAEKQRKSEEAQARVLEEASGELAQFYRERTETIQKRKAQNREAEELTKQRMDSTEGTTWARACDMIDMQQMFTKDISRLKSTMLRLKNMPPRAVASSQ